VLHKKQYQKNPFLLFEKKEKFIIMADIEVEKRRLQSLRKLKPKKSKPRKILSKRKQPQQKMVKLRDPTLKKIKLAIMSKRLKLKEKLRHPKKPTVLRKATSQLMLSLLHRKMETLKPFQRKPTVIQKILLQPRPLREK